MNFRNFVFGFLVLFAGVHEIDVKYLALETLTDDINTRFYDEIAPCLSADGETLYFTRIGYSEFDKTLVENGQNLWERYDEHSYNRYLSEVYSIIAGKPVHDPVSSSFNQDIWMARTVNFEFDKVEHPGYPINNALPNSVSAINPLNNELILINQFVEGGGMQKGFSKITRDKQGRWEFPQPINISNYHNSGPDVNVTMSKDGMVMIMSLERKDSFGKSDLYVCFQNPDGSWTTPRNLGRMVNSAYREGTPHLSEDMTTLYFSSNRGRKGTDIFVQTRLDDTWGNWSAPKRFSSPINSKADDSHPYFNEATGYLYFTSKRNGSSDIFRVQIEKPKPKGSTLKLKVINAETREGVNTEVLINRPRYTDLLKTYGGKFRMSLAKEESCLITIEEEGFYLFEEEISLEKARQTKPGVYEIVLELLPFDKQNEVLSILESELPFEEPVASIPTNNDSKPEIQKKKKPVTKVTLKAIQFQKSTPIVLSKSYPTLDKLSKFLRENKEIQIRILGHTDDVGDKNALKKLSIERAEAIKAYLVKKQGIERNRIATDGFGGDQPLNDNSSERLRAQNRRVEVEIIGKGVVTIDLDKK